MGTFVQKTWGEVLHVVSGKNQKNVLDDNGKYPIYGSGGKIGRAKAFLCEAGTTIIGRKGSINNPIYVNERFWNVDTAFGLTPSKELNSRFLFFFCQLFNFKQLDKSTTIPSLAKKDLLKILMPVPPLPEQERIVAKIEELFSQLDAAVAELNAIREKLQIYRQAVLKEAFEGNLTIQWRNNNRKQAELDLKTIYRQQVEFRDVGGDDTVIPLKKPAEWIKIRLGHIFDIVVGGTPSRRNADYWGGNIPWVSSGEIKFQSINTTKENISDLGLRNSSAKIVPAGSVLLAMIGEGKTRGQAAILNTDAAHNQNTASILVSKTPCSPEYLFFFLQLMYQYTRRVGSGNNQKALNKERVKALPFPFASFEEQQLISDLLQYHFSRIDKILQLIDAALRQAATLRQSILKQAFEGNL